MKLIYRNGGVAYGVIYMLWSSSSVCRVSWGSSSSISWASLHEMKTWINILRKGLGKILRKFITILAKSNIREVGNCFGILRLVHNTGVLDQIQQQSNSEPNFVLFYSTFTCFTVSSVCSSHIIMFYNGLLPDK